MDRTVIMTLAGGTETERLGVVGVGEVGSGVIAALLRQGYEVVAYDIDEVQARARLGELGAHQSLTLGTVEQVAAQGRVLSAVIPTTALDCARAIARVAPDGLQYLDVNSTAPGHKRQMREILAGRPRAVLTDGTIGGGGFSMPQGPLFYLAGEGAKNWAELLGGLGFATEVIGATSGDVGRASELKMVRTAFTKGYEALIEESLLAADAMGLLDEVVQSIGLTLDGMTFAQLARHFTSSHALHVGRRSGEVVMSLQTIRDSLPDLATPVLEGVLRRYELDAGALAQADESGAPSALRLLADRLA
jgi:3-hydroxyisobutyrate dehydrogenase-like beta-hydroxyacid dehydrogenase